MHEITLRSWRVREDVCLTIAGTHPSRQPQRPLEDEALWYALSPQGRA